MISLSGNSATNETSWHWVLRCSRCPRVSLPGRMIVIGRLFTRYDRNDLL
jgi:hypothetical protein